MDALEYFKNLKPEDWDKPVTEKWRVKDVLSHLVGWEREVAVELPKYFETKVNPWFMETDDYSDFNRRIQGEFSGHSPEALLAELAKWGKVRDTEIERLGEANIRKMPHMDWIFDEGAEPHFDHHIAQVRSALSPN